LWVFVSDLDVVNHRAAERECVQGSTTTPEEGASDVAQ
jgi:hypothetical protein